MTGKALRQIDRVITSYGRTARDCHAAERDRRHKEAQNAHEDLARVEAVIEAAQAFMKEWREGVYEPESINDLAAALRALDEGEAR